MKRLNLNPEPRWVEIDPELSVAVRPLSPFDLAELFEGDAALSKALADAPEVEALQAMGVGPLLDLIGRFTVLALADWTVCDAGSGERLPVTEEAARALFRMEPALIGDFVDRVIGPLLAGLAALDAEKNVSAPSPDGSSAGATTTAQAATESAPTARRGSTGR